MLPITPPTPAHDLRISDLVGISQLVAVRRSHLAPILAAVSGDGTADLALSDVGRLRFVTPFAPVRSTSDRWAASARLYGRGPRLARYARVEVEVAPWSHHASELRIRPTARAPHAWGVRRLHRYLDLSRLAADELTARFREHSAVAATPSPLFPATAPTTTATAA